MNIDNPIAKIHRIVERHQIEEGVYSRWLWQNENGTRELGKNEYGCADAANILYTIGAFERDPEKKVDLWEKRCCTALVVILLIGALTPAMEIYRGIQKTVVGGKLVQPADQIETLNKYHSSGGIYGNFVSENYDHSLFFQYLAQD